MSITIVGTAGAGFVYETLAYISQPVCSPLTGGRSSLNQRLTLPRTQCYHFFAESGTRDGNNFHFFTQALPHTAHRGQSLRKRSTDRLLLQVCAPFIFCCFWGCFFFFFGQVQMFEVNVKQNENFPLLMFEQSSL